jgi:2-polyprenyl-6-methoxyphenol hydroxylase-like FAD-dependent oxidoreductase
MRKTRVLISGASIAGPALAYWLSEQAAEVTVVERASQLRAGGQAVDFRGPVHMHVLERMGILPAIRAQQTHMQEITAIDRRGRELFKLPTSFASGEVEIQRGDLSRILYNKTRERARYRFGDKVSALTQERDRVDVTFASGATESFDLVIGADGLHSGVRAHGFGPESRYVHFHDYCVAIFEVDNHLALDHCTVMCSAPGRAVSLASARDPKRAVCMLLFAHDAADSAREGLEHQKALLLRKYEGMGWEWPRLSQQLCAAPDLYFDTISHVALDRYAKGRVALLGDAAWGGTLGGQGSGLAIVGAYVLAGELAAANGDHTRAFQRYQARMQKYAESCQQGSKRVGPFFAPRTPSGYHARNLAYAALTSRPLGWLLDRLVTQAATDIELPDYPSPVALQKSVVSISV